MIYWSFDIPAGEDRGILSAIGSIVTSTRWSRLLHQIH
jgi:hypothetical protein